MADYFADDVIVNKLGITDPNKLREIEQKIVAEKSAVLLDSEIPDEPNLAFLKLVHKTLFEDLYDFAGQFRIVDLVKADSKAPFAYARFLDSEAKRVFDDLHNKQYLVDLKPEQFIDGVSNLSAELNALHPFREGNGRTIRLFLILLAYGAGYLLDYSQVSSSELIEADKYAFEGNNIPLRSAYQRITIPR